MPPAVLTELDLNRSLLARQLLLERADLPIPRVLERISGIQDQYAPSGYIGLWTRVRGFERSHLDQALEERTVVQGSLMRATIHLVSAEDYWPFALAIRPHQRRWVLRVTRLPEREVRQAASRIEEALADGPRDRRELPPMETTLWNAATAWIDLVRVPPSGTWQRRRADRYALAEWWVGPQRIEGDPLHHLIRRYLAGFGPAPAADIASFSGVPVTSLRPALAEMELSRFRGEDGAELFDVPGSPLPDPATTAPARLLPTWDATLLVHARRTGFLPERHRPRVFSTRTPHSFPTFAVDGRVAGTWRHVDGEVELSPWEPLPDPVMAGVREEAVGAAALHR